MKRASRLVTPMAMGAGATAAGLAAVVVSEEQKTNNSNNHVALCEKQQGDSVMGMLGDIQTKVRFIVFCFCFGA